MCKWFTKHNIHIWLFWINYSLNFSYESIIWSIYWMILSKFGSIELLFENDLWNIFLNEIHNLFFSSSFGFLSLYSINSFDFLPNVLFKVITFTTDYIPIKSDTFQTTYFSSFHFQGLIKEFQFGILSRFRSNEIVTWSSQALVVLDPVKNCVVAAHNGFSGTDGVAVTGSEIFLLRRHSDTRVIRLSDRPDTSSPKGLFIW